MKLSELVEKHYFHDSSLCGFEYDDNGNVVLTISFCNWMQDYYVEGEPEILKISLRFNNVIDCDFKNYEPGKVDNCEILDALPVTNEHGQQGIYFLMCDIDIDDDISVTIFAQDVEFVVLGVDED
ncbi:MAG: hypothetical protein IJF84_04755 [Thermoguttaceae bacterium]|nr:hypothetical protein [Thermoguttaceae bacterium]